MRDQRSRKSAKPHLDPDRRPSIRTLLAAKLLRDGYDPAQVSELTRVPAALVQLIQNEVDAGAADWTDRPLADSP